MPGYNFLLNTMDGRFYPTATEGSQGHATVIVTDAPDQHSAATALNRGAAVPVADGARWTIGYAALIAAIAGGTRVVATAY